MEAPSRTYIPEAFPALSDQTSIKALLWHELLSTCTQQKNSRKLALNPSFISEKPKGSGIILVVLSHQVPFTSLVLVFNDPPHMFICFLGLQKGLPKCKSRWCCAQKYCPP